MKILIISHEYPPIGGGGANACLHLAKEFGEAGHKVSVVTAWYKGCDEVEHSGNVSVYRVRSKREYIDHSNFSEMLDYLIKAKPLVNKLEKRERFDICHVFFGIPSGPLGLYLKIKYGVPYVIRFGGGDIPGAQKRFALVYKIISPVIKIIWKHAAALVANSKGLKDRAEKFYNKKEIKVIPNGVGMLKAPSKPVIKDENQIVLLFVSRLIEGKGVQDIIPLMPEIASACKELGKDVTLRIVGDGPYRDELEKVAAETNAGKLVEFCGQKGKEEMAEAYMGADIFVFPSRSEGMPNAVLEAMEYGLPVVMTPCEGSEELIHENGYVCNVGYIKDRVVEMCRSSSLREKMGQTSLKLAKNEFSWNKSSGGYLELFDRIIHLKL